MRDFLKMIIANIVAILLLLSGFFVFLFLLIVASSAGKENIITVQPQSVLMINKDVKIIEDASEEVFDILNFKQEKKTVTLHAAIEAIEKAAADNDIKGISIELDGTEAGLTQMDALRRSLVHFKKTGKFVYAYGNAVSQKAYYLGSVADKYYLNPAGGVEFTGLSLENYYLKSFLEKFGIGAEVIRHGKYKAAVEPFLRDDISPENKEQLKSVLSTFWQNMANDIAVSRKVDTTMLNTVADSLYGVLPQLAVQHKLADQLVQHSQYRDILKKSLHQKADEKLNEVNLADYAQVKLDKNANGAKIAVLHASGEIMNGSGEGGIFSDDFVKVIHDIKDDKNVKAVVLRVNSPGGSANAADEILYELKELNKVKPITVSFGDYAASGGYMISMIGNTIFSEPNTLTGSIGVFGVLMNAKNLAERNGVNEEIVQTHPNAAFYTPLSGLSTGGRMIVQRSVEDTYKRFVGFVMQGRKKSFQEIDAIGGGRIWSGVQAKELGLVDQLGGLEDAIQYAAKNAKLTEYSIIELPKAKNPFEKFFTMGVKESVAHSLVQTLLGDRMAAQLRQLFYAERVAGIQMMSEYRLP